MGSTARDTVPRRFHPDEPRRARGRLALVACMLAVWLLPLNEAAAQIRVAGGHSLDGDWVRMDSNYDPNDEMRIAVSEDRAVLSSVPQSVRGGFRVGQVLWRTIRADGSLGVLGSDGTYYAAKLRFDGPDVLHIDIDLTARGNDQTWKRAGPAIDGDWVRVAARGSPEDDLRIRVAGGDGRVSYLPAGAPRPLRTGSLLWRNLGAGGSLEVLGDDGEYHLVRVTVVAPDRLRIDSEAPRVVDGQIWVRPELADEARRLLNDPRPEPDPGLEPTDDILPFEPPDSVPPSRNVPCSATSLPRGMGVSWGWSLSSPTRNDPLAEELGVWEPMYATFPGRLDVPIDIERSRVPGFPDGFSLLWQSWGRRSPRDTWQEHRDLTAAEYETRAEVADGAGLMAVDFEAYRIPAGMRYAGIWAGNPDGIAWRTVYDLTSDAFGRSFREFRRLGYRLVDVEAYDTPDGIRYAGIWHRSCDNTNWVQWRNMDRSHYQDRVDSLSALGYRIVDIESYRTPNGQRYAAIWQRGDPARAWAVHSDRNLTQYLNLHQQYVDEGLRLVDYESYDADGGIRFAGVWAENDPRHDYRLKALLDDSVRTYRETHGIPGISVAVIQDGEMIYRRGFGWADSAAQKAAHSGTIYLTASVAKAIAGTLAARLEERGVVDLRQPTSTYLEDLPDHHTHTVEQLLAKTACVPHYREGSEPALDRTYAFRLPALEQIWKDSLLNNPPCTPGLHYRYSTHGFTYVGAVLEEVVGMPIGDIIAEEIAGPFGLTSMGLVTTAQWGGFGGLGVPRYDLAQGYEWDPPTSGATQPIDYDNTTWKVLGGGLQTNVLDLARFGWLTSTGAIVADTARMWTPLTTGAVSWVDSISGIVPTGLGWILGSPGGRRVAQHDGIAPGARSFLRIYRDDGLVIAILTNQSQSPQSTADDFRHPINTLVSIVARNVFANPPPP